MGWTLLFNFLWFWADPDMLLSVNENGSCVSEIMVAKGMWRQKDAWHGFYITIRATTIEYIFAQMLAHRLQREVSKLYVFSAYFTCMKIHIGHWVGFAFIKQQSYQHNKLHHPFSQFFVVARVRLLNKQTNKNPTNTFLSLFLKV